MKRVLSAILTTAVLLTAAALAAEPAGRGGGRVQAPRRVVALSSTNPEIIRALGKGATLVAVDRSAKQLGIASLDRLPDVGHPYHPNVEGIVALKPDLVLGNEENFEKTTAEQLRAAGVRVVILEPSHKDGVAGLKRRITKVAALYNEPAKGRALNAKIDADVKKLQAKVAAYRTRPKVLFLYAHGPGDAYVYGTDNGADVLIKMAGGVNGAAFTSGSKPLTAEAMVQASPDAIIMLHRGLSAVKGVDGALKLPGVALTPAGRNRRIFAVDNSIRWVGPRFPEFALTLCDQIHAR